MTADGRDAVIFQVHQQPGGNTVQIAQEIKAKLAGFQKQLSSDIKIANWYDQSELILSSEKSVRDSILVGVVFAILILLAFLRNLKITLIAAIAGAGSAGRHYSAALCIPDELQHHDTGRNGRRRGTHHR